MIYKVLTVLDVPKGPSTASLEKKKICLKIDISENSLYVQLHEMLVLKQLKYPIYFQFVNPSCDSSSYKVWDSTNFLI